MSYGYGGNVPPHVSYRGSSTHVDISFEDVRQCVHRTLTRARRGFTRVHAVIIFRHPQSTPTGALNAAVAVPQVASAGNPMNDPGLQAYFNSPLLAQLPDRIDNSQGQEVRLKFFTPFSLPFLWITLSFTSSSNISCLLESISLSTL